MTTTIGDLKIGDTALNVWDLPIEIVGTGDGYYIGAGGIEWVVNGDGKLTPYHSPALSGNGNGNGNGVARPPVAPDMRKAAEGYAAYGWHVIPLHEPLFDDAGGCIGCTCEAWRRQNVNPDYVCRTPGKHPRIRDWEGKATTDPAQIDRWWHAWPTANIGIAAGPSGLVCVDKDTYHAPENDGYLTIANTETVTSLTGGGGEHLIYLHPDGPRISNADSRLPEWVNIRAWGGLFVAPPSLHASGDRYEWEPGYGPHEVNPSELPPALRQLLQESNGRRKADPIPERINEGGRNNTLTSLAGSMRRRGLETRVIEAALLKVNEEQCAPPLPDDEVKAIAASVARYEPGASVNRSSGDSGVGQPLPNILVNERHLAEISKDAFAVLVATNDPPQVFQYGGALARVTTAGGRPSIQLLDQTMLRHRLERVADFVTARETRASTYLKPASVPDKVVADILAYPAWPELPDLNGVVTAPVVGRGGQARIEPGYDPATRLYFHAGELLAIGDTEPTDERVRWAVNLIQEDLLGDFPFKDAASRANAVALFILPFVRPLIDGCTPLHILTAPTPGTGKTLVARVATLPFNSDGPAVMTAGQDEDEWRKRITSLLSGGASHLLIDNIKGALTSGSLAAALSTPLWTDRILGKSQTITLPNRTVWIATGNNIAVDSELARRSVWIRLDSNAEKPWTRTGFKHAALEEWALENRSDLVTAALILIRNWFKAGCPLGQQIIGSFESWARVVGGILECNGMGDFMGNTSELYELSDPTAALWAAFVAEWHKQYGDAAVGVKELFTLADSEPDNGASGLGLLDSLLTGHTTRARKVKLGNLLREREDTVIGGFKIEGAGKLRRASTYRLVRLGM